MKRIIGALMAAVVATTAFAPAASARDYHRGYYSYDHHRDHGDAVAAGVVGLALGAIIGSAITSDNHRYRDRGYYYNRGYYNRGYYRDGYYGNGYDDDDDYGYSVCVVREHRYDPYRRRDVIIEERRPC